MPSSLATPVSVLCDLRHYGGNIQTAGALQALWPYLQSRLIGQPLLPGQPLTVQLSGGPVQFWIVDAGNNQRVNENTSFQVLDVLREPELFYVCQCCGKYGPLRCIQCEDEVPRGKERICTSCSVSIKDYLGTYCPKHAPRCACSSDCSEVAAFKCGRCRRLFGEHFYKLHPSKLDIDYCINCYQILFGECVVCIEKDLPRPDLGKIRCAYKTQRMKRSCNNRLCWEHTFQWKIWGPNKHGLPLCPDHRRQMRETHSLDILYMLITSDPMDFKRLARNAESSPYKKNYHPLYNIYRIRRIINRNCATNPLSFEDLGEKLHTIAHTISFDKGGRDRLNKMLDEYAQTMKDMPETKAQLLETVRAFYQRELGAKAAARIVDLTIEDRFSSPGQLPRYKVLLHLSGEHKWLYIGANRALLQKLQAESNLIAYIVEV